MFFYTALAMVMMTTGTITSPWRYILEASAGQPLKKQDACLLDMMLPPVERKKKRGRGNVSMLGEKEK